jgi:hypothetical protein
MFENLYCVDLDSARLGIISPAGNIRLSCPPLPQASPSGGQDSRRMFAQPVSSIPAAGEMTQSVLSLRNILRTMTKQCWLFRRETGKTGLFIVKNRSSETIRTTLLTFKEGVRIISDDKTNAEFNSWLAGLIDGDGTLEIGTQTKSGHCREDASRHLALQSPYWEQNKGCCFATPYGYPVLPCPKRPLREPSRAA